MLGIVWEKVIYNIELKVDFVILIEIGNVKSVDVCIRRKFEYLLFGKIKGIVGRKGLMNFIVSFDY